MRQTIAVLAALALGALSLAAEQVVPLKQPVPSIIKTSKFVGAVAPTTKVYINLGLRLRDAQGLQNAVDGVSNPNSPTYRHFLSPNEIGEKFGMSEAQFDAVKEFLIKHGFTITIASPQRIAISATGTIKMAEAAFGTKINSYQSASGSLLAGAAFFSYSQPLSVPSGIAPWILSVTGLDNTSRPHHAMPNGAAIIH